MEETTCCFLGPALGFGRDGHYFDGWEAALLQELLRLIAQEGTVCFISALLSELELRGAELVLELGTTPSPPITLECIIPGGNQTDAFSPAHRTRVLSVLDRCHKKTMLWTSSNYMLDCSGHVLALPDAPGLGYAHGQGRHIHLLVSAP